MIRRELPQACALEHDLPLEIYEANLLDSPGVLTQVCPTCRAVAFLSEVDEPVAQRITKQYRDADLPKSARFGR